MKKFILFLPFYVFLCSCSKDKTGSGLVEIRIKNNTPTTFKYSNTLNTDYGTVLSGGVTNYKPFESVPDFPGARIVILTDTIYAGLGYCGTPPIPMLEKAKYSLVLTKDTGASVHYSAVYIKD